jgi:hypothetical protein
MDNFEINKSFGWVCDYRSIMEWGWYKTPLTMHLFMHCVRKANRSDSYVQGILVKRGSFITSYEKLAYETGLTINQVRTSLDKHLLVTGELTKETTNRYTIITVVNYNVYQNTKESRQSNKQTTSKNTNKSQAQTQANNKRNHKQTTNKSQTNHNKQQYNNINKETSGGVCLTGTHTPPQEENKAALPSVTPLGGEPSEPLTRREWRTYCELKGYNEYRAAEEWIKVRGVFTEGQKKKVREYLREHGEE